MGSERKDISPFAEMSYDFFDNLSPTEVSAPAEVSARADIYQDAGSEHSTRVSTTLRKHSIFTHFTKSRNCDVCFQIKKDEKHRKVTKFFMRAVLVQDLAARWIQSFPYKRESTHDTKSIIVILEPSTALKLCIWRNWWNLGKFGRMCHGTTATHHWSETSGFTGRSVWWVKRRYVSSMVMIRIGERWWLDSMECYCYQRKVQDLYRQFGEPLKGPIRASGAMVEYRPSSLKDQ